VVVSISSDPEEVLDRHFIMECFTDAWLGINGGQVPAQTSAESGVYRVVKWEHLNKGH